MWFILFFIVIFIVSIIIIPSTIFSWLRTQRRVVTLDELKTGDILYTSSPGPHGYLFSLAGIQGGHALLVVRDDETGDLNVLEISGYRDNPSANKRPCIRPLADRLECEGYNMFVSAWQYRGSHIPSSTLRSFVEKVKDSKFNYEFVTEHLKQRFLGTNRDLTKTRLCCSELVYLALVHCGVIRFNKYDWADSFRFLMSLPTHSKACDLLVK